MQQSLFLIQILNIVIAGINYQCIQAFDCSSIIGTAINSYAYKNNGQLQFQMTLPSQGSIDLTFPTIWAGSPSLSPLISGSTLCKETTSGVTCSQNNYDFTCSSLPQGNIIIKCTNVMGPHTNNAIGNFIITQGGTTCNGIQVSNFQPYGGQISFTTDQASLYPNTQSIQMIWGNIVLPIAFTSNPTIEVNMLTNAQFMATGTISGYASATSIGSLQSITASSTTLITAQIPLSIAAKDASIKLQMQPLQVNGNTQPITSKIDFLDSNRVLQYELVFPSISVNNNQLTASLSLSSTEINTYTQYSFTVTIIDALNSAGFVRFAISKSLLSSSIVCYCDKVAVTPAISDNYIDIGGCLTSSGPHAIVIQNVLNPPSTVSTITISSIQTIQNGYSVDYMSNFVYTTPAFTPGTLSVSYTRSGTNSDVVGDYSYFSLTIIPKNQITALGTIKMEIPSEIQFVQQTIQTCSSQYGCSITSVTDRIIIFQFSQIVTPSQFTINSITIPIRNPFDTSTTNLFKFTSYDAFGYIIDTISTIPGYSVNTRSSFDGAITISSDSVFTNGLSLKGIFTLKIKTPQFYPIILTVITGDLTVSNNPVCSLSGATMQSCTKMSANQVDILIGGTSNLQPTTLILTISTIKCKDTMTQSTDFEFSTRSTNGLMSYQKGPSVINTQQGAISQPQLIVDKMYYGATNAIYQFNFKLTNQLSSNDYYLEVLCPFTVPTSGVTCKDTSNNQLFCTAKSSNIISITGPFDVNQLIYYIIIGGLPTPTNSQQATTFTIRSFRNINFVSYLVDSSSNGAFIFTVTCPLLNNCRTCNIISIDSVQCLSCYTSQISTFIYMKSQVCVESCGNGYYQDENAFTCKQCSTNCKTCTKQNGNLACIACFDQYKYQDGLCVTNCGETYYLLLPTDSVCSKCDSACMQCSINSSYCQKCQPNIPLYDNKCYASGCESGYYQTTNSNQVLICDICPITCLSCISQQLCTKCQLGQYYLSGSCISECPSGYFLGDDLYTCNQCSPGCDQCSDNLSCVKCKDTYLLKGTSCVIACGDGYYANSTNTACLNCDSKCKTCELKDSTVMCNTCADTYYFSNFTCLTACPSNYYVSNQQCLECSINCVTCTGSYNKCTSCQVQAENPLYLAGSTCVATCPDYYYPDKTTGKCQECAANCTKCTSAAKCTACNISNTMYYLVEGACRADCPTNYQPSGLTCEIIPVVITPKTSPQRFVPVPYLIISIFLSISVLVSKIHKSETFIPGAWLGLNSVCIWGSWVTLTLISKELKEYYFWILVGGLMANYLTNIIHYILVITKINSDPDFIRWKAASFQNRFSNLVFLSISLLLTFPSHKMIMSRYFGFTFFKAKMLNIKGFFYFNCLNGVSVLIVHIPIIVASCLIAYNEPSYDSQIFISAIDAIIVTILTIMILIWETQKSEKFFEEFVHNNYYLNESNPQIEKHEISGFFNNPFEQKSQEEQQNECNEDPKLVNQENDITKQQEQSHDHSQEQSCNIQGISIILSDKHSNVFEHSHRSEQFNPQTKNTNNQKHTVFFKAEGQQVDPDEEPPQASPQSENYSSVHSDHNGHCSFANHSQSPLKDISQIEDSEEQHSQLSIFDEDKNQSPSKQSKALQMQNNRESEYNLITNPCNIECIENNPQIINQQIEKSNLFKKDKSGSQNQESDSQRQQSDSLKQLAKSAQFPNEQQLNQISQLHQSQLHQSQLHQSQVQQSQLTPQQSQMQELQKQQSMASQYLSSASQQIKQMENSQSKKSIATNKAQQGLLTQQNSLQPMAVSFAKQQEVVQKPKKSEEIIQKRHKIPLQNHDSQVPLKNTDNVPSLPSNQFLPKGRNIDIIEPKLEDTQSEPQVIETLQLQVDQLDEQPQFEPEDQIVTNNIPVLMDSRAVEDQDPFDDSIVFQQVKPYKMKLQGKQTRVKSENIAPIKESRRLENIFDSNDSIHTMSDQDWGEHQQSPSEFNSQNQRIEEEQDQSLDVRLPAHSRTQQNSRADFQKQAKVRPVDFEFDNDNNEEQSYVNQTQVNFSNNYQTKQKELEKIYMQKIDKQKFKKKPPKNQPKDLSDAYIHDKVDVEEIDF